MKSTVLKRFTGALCALVCALVLAFTTTAYAAAKSTLRVLYVGDHPNRIEQSPSASNIYRNEQGQIPKWYRNRTSSFERLLSQYFVEVAIVYSDEYQESVSDNYDVTVFGDLPKPMKGEIVETDENGDVVRFEAAQYLSPNFDNASLLIGFVSAAIGEPLELKMDWLCLCLDAHAHNIETNHPIFNYPNKIDLTIKPRPTPREYRYYYNGRDLGDTLPMWQVQTLGYIDEQAFQPGMVSSAEGFADAPDGEIIAAGVNTKSRSAVSLARHGNYFHWGFSASPDAMTDEAKRVFINAIHYIAKYDGQATYSRRPYQAKTREKALDVAYQVSLDTYKRYAQSELENFELQKRHIKRMQNRGEKMSFAERRFLSQKAPDILAESEWLNDRVKKAFPKKLVEKFGTDRDAYLKYYEANLEYLIPGNKKSHYIVDADAKSLELSNRDSKILSVAIDLLNKGGDNSKTAQRILERYTNESFTTAAQWQKWYDRNVGLFYFTDLNGHKFEVVPVTAGSQ